MKVAFVVARLLLILVLLAAGLIKLAELVGLRHWLTSLASTQRVELPAAIILLAFVLLTGWILYHALCQQGRMLLRIEALEDHLDAAEAESLSLNSLPDTITMATDSAASPSSRAAAPDDKLDFGADFADVSGEASAALPASEVDENIELTIGMATYNDFDGVYFTLQALQLYQDLENTELLVIDNYGCDETKNLVENWIKPARYIRATDVTGTAAPRDLVFRQARGNAVLCCDCHVLFTPGAIGRLKQFYREHPDCHDLLQGPLLLDDNKTTATHFEPQWRDQMWGTWGDDPRGLDHEAEPFDIPMQGLGAFSCRKHAWLGFNPEFRGFGGEEGYIHEKFRQAGKRCLCLPWFLWMHRFGRPSGVKYALTVEEKLRNYVIGHTELGLDLAPVLQHFAEHLSPDQVRAVTKQALESSPRAVSSRRQNVSARAATAPSEVRETVRTIALSGSGETDLALSPRSGSGTAVRKYSGEKAPLVSVVLPVYNGVRYLRDAVESVLGQTLQDIEIIIVNDGSTDGTQKIIDGLRKDERVRTVYQRNMGGGHARNLGIGLAKAEYIAVHDADDISLPDRLRKQYAFLEQSPDCGAIGAYMELIDEAGHVIRRPEVSVDPNTLRVVMVEPASLLERNYFVHGSMMMRKAACEAVGKYRGVILLADDYDLWLRMIEQYPMGNMAEVLYQYRDHPESISKNGRLLNAYAQIATGLAVERRQRGSDLLMREGDHAFLRRYGAKLRAAGLTDLDRESEVALDADADLAAQEAVS